MPSVLASRRIVEHLLLEARDADAVQPRDALEQRARRRAQLLGDLARAAPTGAGPRAERPMRARGILARPA
eukprot:1948220-Prymnesium_polylepis.1